MKILVADDDATARVLMRAALRKSGFDVSVAEDGADALRQFRMARFEMVMLDVDMPGLSGYQVCEAIRAEVGELLPIVMVTGKGDMQSIDRAYHAGATDFLQKPINWPLFSHRVRYLLRGCQTVLDLRAADARNAAILQAIPDLLFEFDLEGRCIEAHYPRSDLTGAPALDFPGRTAAEILPPEIAQAWMGALRVANESGSSTGQQFQLQLPHGIFWFELSVSRKATAAGQTPRFIVLSRDITERKEAEQRILRLAFYDSLTGLPNRQSFLEQLNREIRRAQRSNLKLGVLFMDLDGFKNINDTLGHTAGDLFLAWAAERLRQGLRSDDALSRMAEGSPADVELARLGGDEFTALIPDIANPDDALVVARRMLKLMHRPFSLDGREMTLTASIGIALYPDDGEDSATLLKHADSAMYLAKDSGRNNCQFYDKALTRHAMQRMEIEAMLRVALEREQFTLVYQPQVDIAAGRVHSVEALIRWNHPERGFICPGNFIPLAEANGLIIPIGNWVLRTACRDAARWRRDGFPLRVAVNLSPREFKDPHLVGRIFTILTQTGLPAPLLELEVTEGTAMEDTAATIETLDALRARGVRVALDDFGTGYSSLSYLKRMPLSHLKVDGSFIGGLPDDSENRAIVGAILAMAHTLGLSVTAECVETLDQALALKAMACDALQGFFFSRPVPSAELFAISSRRWSLDNPSVDRIQN